MTKILIKSIALISLIVAVSCKTEKIQTSRQLLAQEQELLEEFLDMIPSEDNPDNLNYKDYWTSLAVDTIDKSLETGLIYYELETGEGDKVIAGKEVGYRFVSYYINRNDTSNVPELVAYDSNYGEINPVYYTAGDDNQATGIDYSLRQMRKGGRSRAILPSTIAGTSYLTIVYDFEVTYLSK